MFILQNLALGHTSCSDVKTLYRDNHCCVDPESDIKQSVSSFCDTSALKSIDASLGNLGNIVRNLRYGVGCSMRPAGMYISGTMGVVKDAKPLPSDVLGVIQDMNSGKNFVSVRADEHYEVEYTIDYASTAAGLFYHSAAKTAISIDTYRQGWVPGRINPVSKMHMKKDYGEFPHLIMKQFETLSLHEWKSLITYLEGSTGIHPSVVKTVQQIYRSNLYYPYEFKILKTDEIVRFSSETGELSKEYIPFNTTSGERLMVPYHDDVADHDSYIISSGHDYAEGEAGTSAMMGRTAAYNSSTIGISMDNVKFSEFNTDHMSMPMMISKTTHTILEPHPETHDTYIVIWADPDLATYTNDQVGIDKSKNTLYVYDGYGGLDNVNEVIDMETSVNVNTVIASLNGEMIPFHGATVFSAGDDLNPDPTLDEYQGVLDWKNYIMRETVPNSEGALDKRDPIKPGDRRYAIYFGPVTLKKHDKIDTYLGKTLYKSGKSNRMHGLDDHMTSNLEYLKGRFHTKTIPKPTELPESLPKYEGYYAYSTKGTVETNYQGNSTDISLNIGADDAHMIHTKQDCKCNLDYEYNRVNGVASPKRFGSDITSVFGDDIYSMNMYSAKMSVSETFERHYSDVVMEVDSSAMVGFATNDDSTPSTVQVTFNNQHIREKKAEASEFGPLTANSAVQKKIAQLQLFVNVSRSDVDHTSLAFAPGTTIKYHTFEQPQWKEPYKCQCSSEFPQCYLASWDGDQICYDAAWDAAGDVCRGECTEEYIAPQAGTPCRCPEDFPTCKTDGMCAKSNDASMTSDTACVAVDAASSTSTGTCTENFVAKQVVAPGTLVHAVDITSDSCTLCEKKTLWTSETNDHKTLTGFNPLTETQVHSDSMKMIIPAGASQPERSADSPLKWLEYVIEPGSEVTDYFEQATWFDYGWASDASALAAGGEGLPLSDPFMTKTYDIVLADPTKLVWREDGLRRWIDYTASKANGAQVSIAPFLGARVWEADWEMGPYVVLPMQLIVEGQEYTMTSFDRKQTGLEDLVYMGFNPFDRMYMQTSSMKQDEFVSKLNIENVDFSQSTWASSLSAQSDTVDTGKLAWMKVYWTNLFASKDFHTEYEPSGGWPNWWSFANLKHTYEMPILKFPKSDASSETKYERKFPDAESLQVTWKTGIKYSIRQFGTGTAIDLISNKKELLPTTTSTSSKVVTKSASPSKIPGKISKIPGKV